jgi:hypothetical protein
MDGTWKTTGGGFGSVPVMEIIAVCAACGVGYGIFLAVSEFVADVGLVILFGLLALFVLAVAGAVWATVYRLRHGGELPWAALQRRMVPPPVMHELPGPERPAIPQHFHLHLHGAGADPAAVAEIIRRHGER